MVIGIVVAAGLSYLGYREYKNGKLQTIVSDIQAKVTALAPKAAAAVATAESDVKKVVTAVEADVKKVV
jgi:uncharacterized membrane protein YebE (DUF533 family)